MLLRGVNDDAETLAALMRAFVENRVKPYYLHHGDLAPGTAHLRTTIEEGQALMRGLRGRLSGLCQPTTCSTSPAGTARRRSGRATCAEPRAAARSRIIAGGATSTRRSYRPPSG